jgi:hypothetical protein
MKPRTLSLEQHMKKTMAFSRPTHFGMPKRKTQEISDIPGPILKVPVLVPQLVDK